MGWFDWRKENDEKPITLEDALEKAKTNPSRLFAFKCDFTPRQVQDVAEFVERSKTLEELVLVDCGLKNSTQMQCLFDAIAANNTLKLVDLSYNKFGDDGAVAFAKVMKYKHNINYVGLTDCNISAKGCEELRGMLTINKKIEVLHIAENNLDDKGVKLLCQGILDNPVGELSELVHIDLSSTNVGDEGCKLIGAVIASKITLKTLELQNNRISSNGAKYIAHALMKKFTTVYDSNGQVFFRGLEVLDLSNNKLGDEGVMHFAKKLSVNCFMKELRLNNVGMKAASFEMLCKALVEIEELKCVSLGGNDIEEGKVAESIMLLVSRAPDLEELDLSGIQLSASDVKLLGEFLGERIKCRLKKLVLSNCNIDDKGATYIANGLKNNMELVSLNVTSNSFGPKGARAFGRAFRRAKTLEHFSVTGQSRIGAEGENYLAEVLKYNKKLQIRGAGKELDYMNDFVTNGKAFTKNSKGEITGWSEQAWEVVKRGCGQIIATVILNMSKEEFKHFKEKIVLKSRNVVNQDMFEYIIRHAETPALEAVSVFVNKCKIGLDHTCASKASSAMMKEKPKSDDGTYRHVALTCAKDLMVKEMAKNNRLFLGRYLTENGPAVHETHEITRFMAKDTMAAGEDKKRQIFVQIYENDFDFANEVDAREDIKQQLQPGGPFAMYDTLLKEIEVHEEDNCVSFMNCITDLRHCINNLGVTSGYNIHETAFLAKRAAQCLGTINNLGRIHGDFKPRNFLKVARKRFGQDPVGRTQKKVLLPDKWVVFDLSKSVPHGVQTELRLNSSYVPPEIARVMFNASFSEKQMPAANEKMDVWSFGVVLYQLLTGVHLFHVETNTDRIFMESERLELMNWINLDKDRQGLILHRANESLFANKTTFERIKAAATDLVNWCLQGDPFNRPSFNEILSHPFFTYKTQVNYSDVDLLLGWYKKIGANSEFAERKNNRTHAHFIQSGAEETSDIFKVLTHYFGKAGCSITNDEDDRKFDIDVRREKVQKSRALIIPLDKDVFWNTNVMQKILWAMDSIETQNLILLDISTAFTNVVKFDFDEYINELQTEEGKKKLDDLVDTLVPIPLRLGLNQIPHEKSENVDKQKKWLKNYIKDEVNEYILALKNKVVPYRSRNFLTEAMANEMLRRSGFVDPTQLKVFSLSDNSLKLYVEQQEEEEKKAEQEVCKVLVLFNDETVNSTVDALQLRSAFVNGGMKTDLHLIRDPKEVYHHFTAADIDRVGRVLKAVQRTLVLCVVSPGFYDKFRNEIQWLNSAQGPVAVLPINYDYFDVAKQGKEEVLNLGLENSNVLSKLKDDKFYIPLPKLKENLKYETEAALDYITKEGEKLLELTKENEGKDENDVFMRYEKTNFLRQVY